MASNLAARARKQATNGNEPRGMARQSDEGSKGLRVYGSTGSMLVCYTSAARGEAYEFGSIGRIIEMMSTGTVKMQESPNAMAHRRASAA